MNWVCSHRYPPGTHQYHYRSDKKGQIYCYSLYGTKIQWQNKKYHAITMKKLYNFFYVYYGNTMSLDMQLEYHAIWFIIQ